MKKVILIIFTCVAALIASFLIYTGFTRNPNVALAYFSVSEGGTEMTLDVFVGTSIGYVRGFKDTGEANRHFLTFYSTFGGINSSFGARNTFTLEIAPEDTEIYFNRSVGDYELVLVKDEKTGQWINLYDRKSYQNEAEMAEPFVKIYAFSYAEDRKKYVAGAPGVKTSGFVNTSGVEMNNPAAAIERAKSECTVEWDFVKAYLDTATNMWKIGFYTRDSQGEEQDVYLDSSGVTALIVYED